MHMPFHISDSLYMLCAMLAPKDRDTQIPTPSPHTITVYINMTLLFQETQAGPERQKWQVTRLWELLEETLTF